MSTHPVLLQDHLIQEILQGLSHCERDDHGVCTARPRFQNNSRVRSRTTCIHTHTLAACTLVSRRWTDKAIKVLWGKYAGYEQLKYLLSLPQEDVIGDGDKKVSDRLRRPPVFSLFSTGRSYYSLSTEALQVLLPIHQAAFFLPSYGYGLHG
jgi:hypothetical protein